MRNSLARSITVTDVTKSRALNPESKVSVITDANLRSWLLICYSHNFLLSARCFIKYSHSYAHRSYQISTFTATPGYKGELNP